MNHFTPLAANPSGDAYCVFARPEKASALIASFEPLNRASLNYWRVLSDSRLSPDARDLARDLFEKTTEWMIGKNALCMAIPLATNKLLAVVRERGPERYRQRRDGNSTYSHEFGQIFYQFWMDEERPRIVKRIIEERTGGPLNEASPDMIAALTKQLDAELTDEKNALYASGSASHDIKENYGVSPEDYMAYLVRHTGIDPECPFMRDLKTIYIRISRLPGESEIAYMTRQTADLLTAYTKVKDRMHNMGTALLAGRDDNYIQDMLDGAESFLNRIERLQESKEQPFLLLEYTSYYLRDQVKLYRLYYSFFGDNSDENRQQLDDHMNKVKRKWARTWTPHDIHPMLSITDRMDQILEAYDRISNPPAPKQDLERAPSGLPASGRMRPRAA